MNGFIVSYYRFTKPSQPFGSSEYLEYKKNADFGVFIEFIKKPLFIKLFKTNLISLVFISSLTILTYLIDTYILIKGNDNFLELFQFINAVAVIQIICLLISFPFYTHKIIKYNKDVNKLLINCINYSDFKNSYYKYSLLK